MSNYIGNGKKKTNQGRSSRSKYTTKNRIKLKKKKNKKQG